MMMRELLLVSVLPPCGRGPGQCEAIIETNPTTVFLRCLNCNCVAPMRRVHKEI
jgi:hypothetical protein